MIFLLIIPFIVGGPLLLIWAINCLFGLAITYTFAHWFAAVVLMLLFGGRSSRYSKTTS